DSRWRPYIKKAIEDWQPALESAGFKNAIIAKDEPVNDSAFSFHDMSVSYVLWHPLRDSADRSTGAGRVDYIIDESTGEILKVIVSIGENALRREMYWYFTQCSPLDTRAWQYPMPDELAGELLRSIVAHETGHALGLTDGHYGRFSYPVDSLRSQTWVKKMSHTPSVMNYTRHNYVAQPQDKIEPRYLVQRVGIADIFNIRCGYTPIPESRVAEEELPVITSWLKIQESDPLYVFLPFDFPGMGPYTSDAMDDTDPVKSSRYGLANLRRVMSLLSGNKLKFSDTLDYADLYNETLEQRSRSLERVIDLIGGNTIRYKTPESSSIVFTPIPANQQREAMKYLDTAAFATPEWVVKAPVTARFASERSYNKIKEVQGNLLKRLLLDRRLNFIEKQQLEAEKGQHVYTVKEVLNDIKQIVWKELYQNEPSIDSFRQSIQTTYLLQMKDLISPERTKKIICEQVVSLCQADIEDLNKLFIGKLSKIKDQKTKEHIHTSIDIIEEIKNKIAVK
ncbi:MAG: zinc-dependent metalloprotease, partial [Chitinophagaceae bacterium]|nr:zinc-dependent metalloprotease [Chitinophagaceae bacterium]